MVTDVRSVRRWPTGSRTTRGSWNSARTSRPCCSMGSRTMLTSARPSSSTSTWSSQVVRSRRTFALGCRPVNTAVAGVTMMPGMKPMVSVGVPCPADFTRRTSARAEASRGTASSSNCSPAAVSSVPRRSRSKTSAPRSCSRLRICRDSAGWAMCSRSAARPKWSSSATATKYRSFRRSRSIRDQRSLSQCDDRLIGAAVEPPASAVR